MDKLFSAMGNIAVLLHPGQPRVNIRVRSMPLSEHVTAKGQGKGAKGFFPNVNLYKEPVA